MPISEGPHFFAFCLAKAVSYPESEESGMQTLFSNCVQFLKRFVADFPHVHQFISCRNKRRNGKWRSIFYDIQESWPGIWFCSWNLVFFSQHCGRSNVPRWWGRNTTGIHFKKQKLSPLI